MMMITVLEREKRKDRELNKTESRTRERESVYDPFPQAPAPAARKIKATRLLLECSVVGAFRSEFFPTSAVRMIDQLEDYTRMCR
jgi:hypothetical protein